MLLGIDYSWRQICIFFIYKQPSTCFVDLNKKYETKYTRICLGVLLDSVWLKDVYEKANSCYSGCSCSENLGGVLSGKDLHNQNFKLLA